MAENNKIAAADVDSLTIIQYPDPRLKEVCTPVAAVDDSVRALVARMFKLMFAGHGVGLAAPQVGITVRLFVSSPSYEESDRRVYINPEILSSEGNQEAEEGCLSLPAVACSVKRANVIQVRALDLDGESFQTVLQEFPARVFQHEHDHLEGITLADRMGSVARLRNRRALKDLQEQFAGV